MTPDTSTANIWTHHWAQVSPNALALVDGETERTLNYFELHHQTNNLAAYLSAEFQIQMGDRLAVMAQNELEYIVLFLAVQRLGAILVPINTRFTISEVRHIVRDSEPKLMIADASCEDNARAASLSTPFLRFVDLASACQLKASQEILCHTDAEDACMILYTSGTTGFPKGAIISHRMIFWNSINTGLRLNLTGQDVVVTFLPLFHTGGWNVLTTPCLHRGAKVVLLKKFESSTVLEVCEREKVSVLFGVPTTMDFLLRDPEFQNTDLSSIRYAIVGGEPMPLNLITQWEERGIPIRQGYGLTEFGPNVFSLNAEDSRRKMGSIGFPNFYVEAKVVDDNSHPVRAGEVGELILRGPVCMSGYWRNPEATAQTMRQGWLYTGDLVRHDEEGYFYVVGRKKEMFISGGENVYPAEVEKVLRSLTGVREAAVIGVPHPKWGECGKAFLSLDSAQGTAEISIETLRTHCLNHLAKFKVPQEFVVLPELPKTQSGKIAKQLLQN